MHRTVVIDIVGLSETLLGPQMPHLTAFAERCRKAPLRPAFPAVTTTGQANYMTGKPPREHGIVGNGWYNRELAEVQFWKQPERLVQHRKVWDELRAANPGFTCAKLFWWYNMYSTADFTITPRPLYPADGRKVFDIYTSPASLHSEIQSDLGKFPFPTFWGPTAGRDTPQGAPDAVTRWIAEAGKWIESHHQPTLNLLYLPHLDYNLQRFGPEDPRIATDLARLDTIVGDLIDFFESREVRVILLSEYSLVPVGMPVHLNREFRRQGWITVKQELGLERLDCGACRAFAVADHQVAHIYLRDPTVEAKVRNLLEHLDGVGAILGAEEKRAAGLDHERAGDLVVEAVPDAWFTYYYWFEDRHAPDFARCVDIHRKPGFDPVELFLDPDLRWPRLKVAWRLMQRRLGMRMLMDVIPLRAELVRGSHGRRETDPSRQPILLAGPGVPMGLAASESTDVYNILKSSVLD